jgi:hypothetical protein
MIPDPLEISRHEHQSQRARQWMGPRTCT